MAIWVKICIVLLIMGYSVSDYELADNPSSSNVYRPDYQDAPIIGPPPHNITFGSDSLTFNECNVQYTYDNRMLDEIVAIYRDVTFGKGYKGRCTSGVQTLKVKIVFTMANSNYQPPHFSTVYENYTLSIDTKGNVVIKADYYPGVVRGLDTLSQLIVKSDDESRNFTISYLPIDISDEPSFPYRGIMIDTGREFFFPDILKMTIDGMMLSRVNVLHWHFSEDDSIAMYSESYPDLVNYTAFSKKEVYSPDDVKDIVHYAKVRGVRIIPEMEGPAHLHILGFYPEFRGMVGCFRNYTSTESYHGGPPYAPVNPANELTYTFLRKYLTDLNKLFDTDVWHLGGDEVNIG